MSKLPDKPIPETYRRIILVNPTRYLGNLLIAGGLIQDFHDYCQTHNITFRIVIDGSFRELLEGSFPPESLIHYPRQEIKTAPPWKRIQHYLSCLRAIRAFKADIAFNIEEDSVSHRLTQLSAARFKLGCSIGRHRLGYDHVLRVVYAERSSNEGHRWFGFRQSFQALGLSATAPGYLQLAVNGYNHLRDSLSTSGLDQNRPLIALHAGATKDFKRWPLEYFVELARQLRKKGMQVALIGAGAMDASTNREIIRQLQASQDAGDVTDLSNRFSLAQLAGFLSRVEAMVGNDSGPAHLAAALHTPVLVIFGPTETGLWRPLTSNSQVLQSGQACNPQCSKTGCLYQQRCLISITPELVMENLRKLLPP